MHVRADSPIPAEEIRARLAGLAQRGVTAAAPHAIALDSSRRPEKLFLRSFVLTIPPAAEIALQETEAGSSVVLRLMWGPLPAPFPRVVAAIGVLLAVAVLIFGGGTAWANVGVLLAQTRRKATRMHKGFFMAKPVQVSVSVFSRFRMNKPDQSGRLSRWPASSI